MKIAVPTETFPDEHRVALVPAHVPQLAKAGLEVTIQAGAGQRAGFTDAQYADRGAAIVEDRSDLLQAELILQVRGLGANPAAGRDDLSHFRRGQTIVAMCDPLGSPEGIRDIAETGATLFALELIPRITRAQSMDVLSSMATIAGYRAVLLSAVALPKLFPLMTTAAGTLTPAKAFVIGAGVAGLQAIATAKRLGAVVSAYDVRPACREQVESVGGKFVELDLDTSQSEGQGGYAKALGEEFYQKQRELMAEVVAEQDVVITTAAIPGKPSPLLVTQNAVERMQPGSVIVDLATERGGNCEVSQPDTTVEHSGVTILGPTNIVAEVPNHASQMLSGNITKFLMNMVKDGKLEVDMDDEIVRDTLVAHEGDVTSPRIRQMLDLPELPARDSETADSESPQEEDASNSEDSSESNEQAEADEDQS